MFDGLGFIKLGLTPNRAEPNTTESKKPSQT
jgi:hypothetical protein